MLLATTVKLNDKVYSLINEKTKKYVELCAKDESYKFRNLYDALKFIKQEGIWKYYTYI